MWFTIEFYETPGGEKPMSAFITELKARHPALYLALRAGIEKLENGDRHGPPLTEKVDSEHDIFELLVGGANIARAFFFFQHGQRIIVTNGYVKKRQKLSSADLELARRYKQDWEERH